MPRLIALFAAFFCCATPLGIAQADWLRVQERVAGRGYLCEHAPHCMEGICEESGARCLRGGDDRSLMGCFDPSVHYPCCLGDSDCPAWPATGSAERRCILPDHPSLYGICTYTRRGERDDCGWLLETDDALHCFGTEGWANGDCDRDGIPNPVDNCLCTSNADQMDCNEDRIGDVCNLSPPPPCASPVEEVTRPEDGGFSSDSDAGAPDRAVRFHTQAVTDFPNSRPTPRVGSELAHAHEPAANQADSGRFASDSGVHNVSHEIMPLMRCGAVPGRRTISNPARPLVFFLILGCIRHARKRALRNEHHNAKRGMARLALNTACRFCRRCLQLANVFR